MIALANRIKIAILVSLACLFATAEADATTLTGKITLPDGRSAAGVSLSFTSPWIDPQPAGQTTTSADGTYTMELKPGEYRLLAKSGAYISTSAFSLKNDGTITGSHTSFVLPKGCMIMGMVVDQTTGQLLDDARISAFDLPAAHTGTDGTFSMLVPKDRSIWIYAAKEGYATRWITFMPAKDDVAAIKFETKPDATVRGTVTDEAGKPVQGACVGTDAGGGGFSGLYAYTDAGGNYSISGIDPDETTDMDVRADGFVSIYGQALSFQSGSRESVRNFTLKLAADKRTITGRVTSSGGSPVKSAYVMFGFGSSDADRCTTTTDSNGCYTLKDVIAQRSVLMAHYQGFAHSFALVPDKGNARIDLVLQPSHTIKGCVVDTTGKPLAEARLGISVPCLPLEEMGYSGSNSRYYVDSLTTDQNGCFEAGNMPSGPVYASAGLTGYDYAMDVQLSSEAKDNTITLARTTRFKGKVVDDADGTPITSFTVTTEQISPLAFNSPDGTFSLSNSRPKSEYLRHVTVSAPGYLQYWVGLSNRPEGERVLSDVTEFRMKRAKAFSGRVTDNAGKPLEGVQVTLIGTDIRTWSNFTHLSAPVVRARTDADGRFATEPLSFASGTVALQLDGYARKLIHPYDFSKPLDTAMAPAAKVTIDLGAALGSVPSDASIAVRNSNTGESMGNYELDSKGKVSISELSGGRYSFLLSYGSDWVACREAEIKEGETYALDWNAKQPVTVTGTFTIRGKPFANARVLIHSADGEVAAVTRTNAKGGYTVSVHEPGHYGIMCDKGGYGAPSYQMAQAHMELKAGTNRINGAALCCSIFGTVIDARTKKPITDAEVQPYLWTTAPWWQTPNYDQAQAQPKWWAVVNPVKVDSQGRFRIDKVAPGDWIISAEIRTSKGAVSAASRKFTVRPDETRTGIVVSIGSLDTGSASVTVKDESGNVVEAIDHTAGCVDENGFVHYVAYTRTDMGDYIETRPVRTPGGGTLFNCLPAGKYRFVMPAVYLAKTNQRLQSASAEFEVSPGKQTSVTVTAQPASAIVFRLTPGAIEKIGFWGTVGYRILKAGSGEPVIKSVDGLKWGGCAYLGSGKLPGSSTPTATIPLPPGEYTVEAVLGQDSIFALYSKLDMLWSINTTVKVEPDKDSVIDIDIP